MEGELSGRGNCPGEYVQGYVQEGNVRVPNSWRRRDLSTEPATCNGWTVIIQSRRDLLLLGCYHEYVYVAQTIARSVLLFVACVCLFVCVTALKTRSPASAGTANRPLVFLGIFFNFRTRMVKLGVQVAKGCHFHVVKTE